MNIYKEEKGITLLILAITVIVMIILIAVGLSEGIPEVSTIQDSKLISEAKMIQHAVLEQYVKYKTTKNEEYLIGNKVDKDTVIKLAIQMGVKLVQIPSNYTNADYYKLTANDVAKLGFDNVSDEYIINYVSGEVINCTHIKDSEGTPIYIKGDTFATQ